MGRKSRTSQHDVRGVWIWSKQLQRLRIESCDLVRTSCREQLDDYDGWICQGIGNEMGTNVFCILVVTCCGDRLEHCDRIHSCVLSEETT